MTIEEAVSDVLTKVKILQPAAEVGEGILTLYAQKLVSDILDYCNQEDFPESLTYTAAELICKRLKDEGGNETLKSLQMNDTKFEFNVGSVSAAGCMSDEDFNTIKSKLNKYRKLVLR